MESRVLAYARAFAALGRELNFGRAGESLGLSQSAISRQVAELESDLGFALVRRTTRQVALTPAGQRLWDGLVVGLGTIDEAVTQAREYASGRQGVVRIGYTRVSLICRCGVAISALRREFPEITIEMHEMRTNTQVDELLADRIDIGLLHPPLDQAKIRVDRLSDEPLVVVAPPTHPLAARSGVTLAELCGEPTILYPRKVGPHLYDQIAATCDAAGHDLNIIQTVTSWESAVDLAANGLGVAWAPKVLAARRAPHVVALDIIDPLPRLLCGVATVKGRREASVRTLVERIVANAADSAA